MKVAVLLHGLKHYCAIFIPQLMWSFFSNLVTVTAALHKLNFLPRSVWHFLLLLTLTTAQISSLRMRDIQLCNLELLIFIPLSMWQFFFVPSLTTAQLFSRMTTLQLFSLRVCSSDCCTARTELRTTLSVAFLASSVADNCVDSVLHWFHSLPQFHFSLSLTSLL